MNHRRDRSRVPGPRAFGHGAVAGWEYGFDEPGLRDGFEGVRLPGEERLNGAFRQESVPGGTGRCQGVMPGTFAGRAARWLFADGGIIVVLVLGLLAVAIGGGLLSGRRNGPLPRGNGSQVRPAP